MLRRDIKKGDGAHAGESVQEVSYLLPLLSSEVPSVVMSASSVSAVLPVVPAMSGAKSERAVFEETGSSSYGLAVFKACRTGLRQLHQFSRPLQHLTRDLRFPTQVQFSTNAMSSAIADDFATFDTHTKIAEAVWHFAESASHVELMATPGSCPLSL